MGCDKALITTDGITLVERAAAALGAAGADPVIVVGGDRPAITALGLHVLDDRWPHEGPLGGIITALDALETDLVAVLSCDLTAASAIAVASVVRALGTSDVSVPVVDGRTQWMHAVWRRTTRGSLHEAFSSGIRAPREAVDTLQVAQLLDGDPCWFHDADRPEDLLGHGQWALPATDLASIAEMDLPEIDVDELSRQLDQGAALFDVREDDEWEAVHIDGATLIPLGSVVESVGRFPADRAAYVICAKGGRSARAVEFLRSQGIEAVNVAGGMAAWVAAGKSAVTGNGG